MSISIRNNVIRQQNTSANDIIKKSKAENKDEILKKPTNSELKDEESYGKEKSTLRYVLVGDIIKVFLVSGGKTEQLIKTIPIMQASPEVLAQCENISFIDIINIMEMQEEEKNSDGDESKNDSKYDKANKGVSEYLKHDSLSTSSS